METIKRDIEAAKQEFEMCTMAVDASRIHAQQLRKEADECIKKARERALETLARLRKFEKQLVVTEIADKMVVSDTGSVLINKETARLLGRGSTVAVATDGTALRFITMKMWIYLKQEGPLITGLDPLTSYAAGGSRSYFIRRKNCYNLIKDLEFKTSEGDNVFPFTPETNAFQKAIKIGDVDGEIVSHGTGSTSVEFNVAIRTDKKPTKN